MKKTIFIFTVFIVVVELFPAQIGHAQGTLYASSMGGSPPPPIPLGAIGSDSWLAQPFYTGTNPEGYVLNSVQLAMFSASGSPSGFSVLIYNQSDVVNSPPMNNIGGLSGSNPNSHGIYNYMTSGIMLSPLTVYYVVVTAATPIAQGAYNWTPSSSGAVQGWGIFDGYDSSSDGSNWQYTRNDCFALAIYATAIPEPSTISLLTLGTGILFYVRRRK